MKRKDFQLIGVNDDFLSLMDDTGDMREDLKCPEDSIGDEIRTAIEKDADILVTTKKPDLTLKTRYEHFSQVTVLAACGEECVIATKMNTAVDK